MGRTTYPVGEGSKMKDIFRPELADLVAYQPGKPISEVKRELGLTEVIKLASNEAPFEPVAAARQAMIEAMSELNRYPDGSCFELKAALAEHLGVSAQEVLIGGGSNELLRLMAQAILGPGDEAVMACPSFVVYPHVVKMMGAKAVEVPLADHRHDLAAMKYAITVGTKLVFIANPNNPTGTIVDSAQLKEFLSALPDSLLAVVDEAYFEYIEDPGFESALGWFRGLPNLVVLRTFSKIYGLAGIRIGYGVAPAAVVRAVDKIREPFNVNSLAQVAAMASLGAADEIVKRRDLTVAGKEYLCRNFEAMGLAYVPSEANFVLVDTGVDSRHMMGALLEHGVIVRSGDVFGYPMWIRVTIGTPEENGRFIQALADVLAARGPIERFPEVAEGEVGDRGITD